MKINLKNGDRSKWETHSFDKIVNRIAETVDPNTTELDLYIGLEHIDAEDVHIRRTGKPSDVSGGKLRCYPNDVIFGKRRAYQRKAGIVTKAGICSAHSFVFRANENVISAKLLPFFLHSDQFMNKMIDISVGGLSPTINWTDLKHQKFLLPPKEQQAELADLLWALDEVIEKDLELLQKLETFKKVEISDLKNNNQICAKYLFDIKWGNTNITKKQYIEKGFDAYSASGNDGFLSFYEHEINAIILSAIGAECGKCFLAEGKWTAIKNTITLIPNFENFNILKLYFHILNDKNYWTSTGGAQPFITQDSARNLLIPNLVTTDNLEKIEIFNKLIISIINIQSKIQSSKDLQKSLINQLF